MTPVFCHYVIFVVLILGAAFAGTRGILIALLAVALVGLVIGPCPAEAAEMRIEHTSRITKKTVTRLAQVDNCVTYVYEVRKRSIGKIRGWCNGVQV